MAVGRIRPAVQGLATYRPGKAAAQAEEEHGITDAIKVASNENPYPPHPKVLEAIVAAASGVNRYADHRATELRARIGHWLGLSDDHITVGCGSVGLLQQLCLTFIDPGDEVVYPWRSFEAYPINVKLMGGIPVTTPLVDHAFDLNLVAEAITDKTKMIMLATPNNPTGTALRTDEITELMTRVPDDVIVVIDEAYREFTDPSFGDPVADVIPHHRNVLVTRTFSKAYGLAGLRSGYMVADPEVITEVDKVLLAFAVNGLAQAGAMAALDHLEEIQPTIDNLLAERTRLVSELQAAGWELPDTQANFVWLPLGDRTDEVYLAMERQGVVTRPFSGEGIRITVSSPEENDRILRTLAAAAMP